MNLNNNPQMRDMFNMMMCAFQDPQMMNNFMSQSQNMMSKTMTNPNQNNNYYYKNQKKPY